MIDEPDGPELAGTVPLSPGRPTVTTPRAEEPQVAGAIVRHRRP